MPPVEEAAAPKPTIGIIYPPPEVRNIVDRTAVFVARNGPEFEARIRQNELNNPKFNFLNGNDPYNSYYKHKVKEVVEGKVPEPTPTPKSGLGYIQQKPASEQQQKLLEAIIPKEPPPEFEYIAEAPSISAYDLDVVRLTAQFVARNGRQFLNNLMNRESRNFQFDFLRPQHSLFNYFTKLVEQYTKILLPPKDLIPKLEKESGDTKNVLSQVTHRVEWTKLQERERKREEDEKEKERVAYAQIDWHDFVAVEVVDFQPHETGNFPPPTIPDEVGARLIAQERYEHNTGERMETKQTEEDVEEKAQDEETSSMVQNFGKVHVEEDVHARGADTSVQDMEEDSDSEGEDEREKIPIRPPPPIPKEASQFFNSDQIIIRKDYNPKARKPAETSPAPDKFLISPITGEKIPADKIQEHMRIGLLDSKWIEQRDKTIQDRREQEEVYAPGSSIGSNLRQLAERRTDIFGSGTEETQIGKKIGEEEKKEKAKVIWDGHSTSMEKVAQKARENITIEDQIAVIHKTKGLLPDDEKEKIGPAMPKNIQSAPQQPHTMTNLTLPQQPPVFSSAPAPPPVRPPVIPAQPPMRPPIVAPMAPARGPLGMMTPLQMQPGMVLMGQAPGQPGVMPQMSMGRPPFLPPGGLMPGLGQPHMIPMQPQFMDQHDDEPANKRQKTDESLIPADEFIARNISPVEFKVQLPMIEKSEWKLNGQSFAVTLHLTDHVNVIKAKIFEEVGMPPGKQKLQLDGMFLKESNSLAYYNITPHSVVHLQLKERGGRKK